ncbi:MAG TPA: SigE family RNA polymerase sigma factor [Actinospica sp.]|jgi:RNA polymerase sigma-70 factor (sigma-E family)|nr:SigE family RNA polymerase sigma factor [Actinospica sp.]
MSFPTQAPPVPAEHADAVRVANGSPAVDNTSATIPGDFAAYVAERRSSLLRTAHQVAGDRTEAEDLLQEGLLKTYQAWHRIEDKAVVGSYLRRTMTNHQISQWRKRRVEEYPTDELPERPYDGESMTQVEMRVAVARALGRLSARDREALSLRYYGSYTDTEIAERMGVSVGTVKSALWRALRKLREDPSLRPLAMYVTANTEWLEPVAAAA